MSSFHVSKLFCADILHSERDNEFLLLIWLQVRKSIRKPLTLKKCSSNDQFVIFVMNTLKDVLVLTHSPLITRC